MANYVKIGEENTFGTAVAGTPVKVTAFADTDARGEMIEETIDADLPNAIYGGALNPSGSIHSPKRLDSC